MQRPASTDSNAPPHAVDLSRRPIPSRSSAKRAVARFFVFTQARSPGRCRTSAQIEGNRGECAPHCRSGERAANPLTLPVLGVRGSPRHVLYTQGSGGSSQPAGTRFVLAAVGKELTVRVSDVAILALIVVQTVAGLTAAWWRSTTRTRHDAHDLTDLTALSRSAAPLRPGRSRHRWLALSRSSFR